MEQIIAILKIVKGFLCRFYKLPVRFWFNIKTIGNNTVIDRRYICIKSAKDIHIGNRCTIMAGARIEAISNYEGVNFNPHIIINDRVCINQNFHCTCADYIEIGEGTSITANCGVFDITHPYTDINTNPRNAPIEVSSVIIGKNSLIGMNSVIMPGVHLGKHTIVGANSTVLKGNYPDYCVLVGSPAKIVKRYDITTNKWVSINNDTELLKKNNILEEV